MRGAIRLVFLLGTVIQAGLFAQGPQPTAPQAKVLVFFSLNAEADHVLFATDALRFLAEAGDRHNWRVEATSNWADLNEQNLAQYQLVVWLNGTAPAAQQPAFQRYMDNGGAWLGFHVSAYNDRNTGWAWFKQFVGGGAFGVNNWPPLPAKVTVDDTESPVTQGIPKTFIAPANEWYSWRPSPRLDKNIHVLVTLDPSQYPIGIKSMISDRDPDVPVVWTNTRYKMLYMNMGHGDKIFTSSIQNTLIENGLVWLLGSSAAVPGK
jgi:type 1 glutamine amidotransferase